MSQITMSYNNILRRGAITERFKNAIIEFEKNVKDLNLQRGIYIYGISGVGKTHFVKKLLEELGYDNILYDAGDTRNKAVFDSINSTNMGTQNILSMFQKKPKKLAIIMDEIDGMNNGDKGGINSLIKLIRPKKTKKQREENITLNPIICIGNYYTDKKIKELMKVCICIEIKTPTNEEMSELIEHLMPDMSEEHIIPTCEFIKGDLRKLQMVYDLFNKNDAIFREDVFKLIYNNTNYNDDTKLITAQLLTKKYGINDINTLLNETDKTSVALLFHENVMDFMEVSNIASNPSPQNRIDFSLSESVDLYQNVLDNICFADYMDRITFQKQLWLFTEITFIIKTIYNNNIIHNSTIYVDKVNSILSKKKENKGVLTANDIRFTKILTKYSSEYNNNLFIQKMCRELDIDKKDLYIFFLKLRGVITEEEMSDYFENYNIDKLEIMRLYKFLDYIYNGIKNTEDKIYDDDEIVVNDFYNIQTRGGGSIGGGIGGSSIISGCGGGFDEDV